MSYKPEGCETEYDRLRIHTLARIMTSKFRPTVMNLGSAHSVDQSWPTNHSV